MSIRGQRSYCNDPAVAPIRVFVALEMLLERDAIARAISLHRPDWQVLSFSPLELDPMLRGCQPDVVICTTITSAIDAYAPMWVVLADSGSEPSVISINGQQSTRHGLRLSAIIEVIDQACP